jgi:putative ABC transport system permease protein
MSSFGRFRGRFDGFTLDLKLGARMLLKYPGLTLVGGLAMAFAICVGTVIFEVVTMLVYPSLPLPAGERIVQIRNWDVAANDPEPRALDDFINWRAALRSVTELGVWRDATRNLIVTEGDARPVQVAEMTASGFRVADGTPLLGRTLVDTDERAGAQPVAVIGYDLWQARFGGASEAVGRTVQLGNEHVTVVGVMREGFAFPVSHELWTPLRIETLERAPRSGPSITVFGLLAPGVSLEMAQAELTTLGRRAAMERPATHEHLQPRVGPYATMYADVSSGDRTIMFSINFVSFTLLVLVCGNVALLLFARAATRESELVVRTALGASRGRLVVQLFAEALVLGGVAAVVGLAAAQFALRSWGLTFLENNLGRLPFWYDLGLSLATVLFASGLTVLGSAIAGVVPALKITRGMGSRLKQAAAGAGGLQFGGVWTVVIVVQVAFTVAFPAVVYVEQWQLRHTENFPAGFAAEEYLGVRIQLEAPIVPQSNADSAYLAQRAAFAAKLEELRRRVASEPTVAGVTFVDRLPRTYHPEPRIEVYDDSRLATPSAGEADARSRPSVREAHFAGIDPSYFDVLEAPILAGRAFHSGDLVPGARAVIVDQGFVDQVLEGRNPIGQRVRFAQDGGDAAGSDPNPWFEVVGVVKELGMSPPTEKGRATGLYFPVPPALLNPIHLMVHVRGDPMLLAPRLREIGAAIDPTLRLSEFQRLDEVTKDILWIIVLWLRISIVMTTIAVVLSLAGIYAVLSFTVARRTREIGIRVALGASRSRVVGAIFRRPLIQVGLGILGGATAIAGVASVAYTTNLPGADRLSAGLTLEQVAMLLAHVTVMLGVCLLACVVPTLRALGVEPTVALRVD